MTTDSLIAKLANDLHITEQEAQSLITTEQKRKEAGERYRQSEAYAKRLLMQKIVRKALKAFE